MKIKEILNDTQGQLSIEYEKIEYKNIAYVSKIFAKTKEEIIVILKENKPYYSITSIDIIDALIDHDDTLEMYEYIQKHPKELIYVSEEETFFEAYRIMRNRRLNYLIVVDKDGYFKKVIHFADFASYLTEIALKDDMTGLYNRRFFDFLIDKYETQDVEVGIVFIDLNNFKLLNDTYGHLFGDKALKEVANIIKTSIRNIDYAFRFGGDEFVVMLFSDRRVLQKVAQRIKNRISKVKIKDINVTCSVGYAHYPTDSSDLYEVVDIADKRMYKEKRALKS